MRPSPPARAACWGTLGLAAAAWLLSAGTAPAQVVGSDSAADAVDGAIPANTFRVRFEAASGFNRPDRAGYFYPAGFDPHLDSRELSTSLEFLVARHFSAFVNLHADHLVDPRDAPNASGLGDAEVGFKWTFVAGDRGVLSFQFKTDLPTGDPASRVGTGHAALEPALLLYERLSERWAFEGDFHYWLPLGGDPVAGDVLKCGAAVSYRAYQGECLRVRPVAELVGWTVLSGKESVAPGVLKDAAGDCIVNARLGARFDFGRAGSLYAGYGRPLTGAYWSRDLARLEYRIGF